jgi:hypothetical protein
VARCVRSRPERRHETCAVRTGGRRSRLQGAT